MKNLTTLGTFTLIFLLVQQVSSMQTRATVTGIVVDDFTGQPLSGVQVTLLAAEGQLSVIEARVPPAAITGQDGTFVLQTTVTGGFRVVPTKDGLIASRTAWGDSTASGVFVRLRGDAQVRDLVLRMTPSGVISGRLLDDQGGPITLGEAWVGRFSYDKDGRYGLRPVGREIGDALTNGGSFNDLGEFRLYNLPPGEYYVGFWTPMGKGTIANLPTLYYPSMTSDQAKALAVHVRPGEETHLLAVQWPARPRSYGLTIRVSSPEIPTRVEMETASNGFLISSPSNSAEEVVRIWPGRYDLVAISIESRAYYASSSFDVLGSDVVQELTLKPTPHVTAKILMENATGEQTAAPSTIGCLLDGLRKCTNSRVLPGVHSLEFRGLPADAYIASAKAGGRDILTDGLSIAGDTELEIVVSQSGATLSGTVRTAGGEKLVNGWVVVVPETPYRATPFRYRQVVTDTNGGFEMRGITPGSYKVFAWANLAGAAYRNAEFLKEFEERGQSIVLESGGHATIDVAAF